MTRDEIVQIAWDVGLFMRSHKFQDEPTKLEQFAERIAAEKDKEIERLQDMLYELLGELTALRAEKQMRGYIKQLKDSEWKEQPR